MAGLGVARLGAVWQGKVRQARRATEGIGQVGAGLASESPTPNGRGGHWELVFKGSRMHNYARHRVALTSIEVARLSSEWVDGPPIDIVASPQDLPGRANPDARGFFLNGRVFIVADQPQCTVGATVCHEAVAHFALREVLGPFWRRFMLALHRGARRGTDVFLRHLRVQVERTYVDQAGRCNLKPRQLADEISAAMAEDCFDRRTGRLLVHDPIAAQCEATVGLIARDILRIDYKITHRQVQGMLLLSEHRLRYGSLGYGIGYWVRRAFQWVVIAIAGVLSCCAFIPF